MYRWKDRHPGPDSMNPTIILSLVFLSITTSLYFEAHVVTRAVQGAIQCRDSMSIAIDILVVILEDVAVLASPLSLSITRLNNPCNLIFPNICGGEKGEAGTATCTTSKRGQAQ
jgi:hypothetical protein